MNEENSKWLVVVNPKACSGRGEKDWPTIKQILLDEDFDFEAITTEYQGHAIEIVRQGIAEKGFRKVISVGGDGTNNEVVNGIFTQDAVPTTEITMGTIPIGTGNDWVKTFDFPMDYQKIVKILKAGHVFAHDIGKVTYYNNGDPKTRFFLNAAGTGLDEMVCEKTNIMKQQGKGGKIRYLLNTAVCLLKFKITHIVIEIDGEQVFEDRILSLSVGNGKFIGGGMMMMPNSIPDDGKFDITVIKDVPLLCFAAKVKSIFDGTFIHKMKQVTTFRGRKIRITSKPEHSLLLETEGETLSNSPFDFEILPKSINMIVKQNAGRKAHIEKS